MGNFGRLFFYPFDFLLAMIFRLLAPCFHGTREAGAAPWVIGGHRGRLYEDNSAALHRYITGRTSQPVIWIANAALVRELRRRGCRALRRNSLAARWAIIRAPVLIYSHGEDDLDQFLKFFRSCLGLRVYLNHGLNYLKMGQYERGGMEHWTPRQKRTYAFEMTDFDVLPAVSPEEKRAFDRAFRYRTDRILPAGGGAHLDQTLDLRKNEPERLILWFPTFRDALPEQKGLDAMMRKVLGDPRLESVLRRDDLRLAVVCHVNARLPALTLPERVSFHLPSELTGLMAHAMMLISDYSSVLLDWMLFDRPVMHFPFDEERYLQARNFFHAPEEICYGPLARTADEFLAILEKGSWRWTEPYAERRRHWTELFFPDLHYGYAESCFRTIRSVRRSFREALRKRAP